MVAVMCSASVSLVGIFSRIAPTSDSSDVSRFSSDFAWLAMLGMSWDSSLMRRESIDCGDVLNELPQSGQNRMLAVVLYGFSMIVG